MPTYVYEVIEADGGAGERFEVTQAMTDAPLAKHPETGAPVKRIITPPNIGHHSDSAAGNKLGDKNLERLGFTKYVKSDDGKYEKTVGKGPKIIKKS